MTAERDRTYNGWATYESWLVALWLTGNDQWTYGEARETARDIIASGRHPDSMREFVERLIFGDEAPASLGTDLILGALSEVDWRSVTDALTEE